uniref:Uncharacterized protein LOC104214042 n=1 Tax=Nicotiana sylvestris TaxID=4096 RepID=A0A1U7V107_NICSY|nr:PREDICTED: uncharacterized protein LOC104214042 [Nicotiana sylvestris]
MKTLSYIDAVDLAKKIENKGSDECAASELCKNAKIGESFNGSFSKNCRAEIRDNSNRVLRQGHICLRICKTCGRSHLGQCRVLSGECFRCGQLGHHLRDFPQPLSNFNQAFIQSAAPTQTTRTTLGAIGTGNRGRGVVDCATVNQG